jgi:pimeloyl-ACP methyl ester carboxylesterase
LPNKTNYKIDQGFVDANGVMIYYETFGNGKPLVVVHGGPGASHDYFLPYLIPLAKTNKIIFIDERGSGKVVFPKSGHMAFVDQPNMFIKEVNEFLHSSK